MLPAESIDYTDAVLCLMRAPPMLQTTDYRGTKLVRRLCRVGLLSSAKLNETPCSR